MTQENKFDDSYTSIPNNILTDPRVSLEEKYMFCCLRALLEYYKKDQIDEEELSDLMRKHNMLAIDYE